MASATRTVLSCVLLRADAAVAALTTPLPLPRVPSALPGTLDVADFEIGAATTLTREHLLAPGGKTCVITNALERLQDVLVRSGPISAVIDARIDVVPSTVTAH